MRAESRERLPLIMPFVAKRDMLGSMQQFIPQLSSLCDLFDLIQRDDLQSGHSKSTIEAATLLLRLLRNLCPNTPLSQDKIR